MWPKRRKKHDFGCTYDEGVCSCGLEQEQACHDAFMAVIESIPTKPINLDESERKEAEACEHKYGYNKFNKENQCLKCGESKPNEEKELMPCPFCGNTNVEICIDKSNWFYIRCFNGNECSVQTQSWENKSSAIISWNHRTTEQQRLDEPDEKEIYEFMCTNYPHLVPRNNLTGKDLQQGIRVIKMVKHISQKFGHAVVSVPSVEEIKRIIDSFLSNNPKYDSRVDYAEDIATAIKNLIENK